MRMYQGFKGMECSKIVSSLKHHPCIAAQKLQLSQEGVFKFFSLVKFITSLLGRVASGFSSRHRELGALAPLVSAQRYIVHQKLVGRPAHKEVAWIGQSVCNQSDLSSNWS